MTAFMIAAVGIFLIAEVNKVAKVLLVVAMALTAQLNDEKQKEIHELLKKLAS